MQDKDKLIIVSYVNVGDLATDRDIAQELHEISEILHELFDYSVKLLIVPIRKGESRVECINPKLLTEAEYKDTREKVEKIDVEFKKWLKKNETNTNGKQVS